MRSKIGKVIMAGGALGLCLTTSVMAATIKELQGAWTMDGTKCEDTFKKVGKTVEFKDRTASTSTGLLISGSKVTGPNAVCTTQSVKKQKDRLSALLSCTDSMIESDVSQTFKIVDANTIQRFDPFGGDMYVTYKKCAM